MHQVRRNRLRLTRLLARTRPIPPPGASFSPFRASSSGLPFTSGRKPMPHTVARAPRDRSAPLAPLAEGFGFAVLLTAGVTGVSGASR